VPFFPSSPFSFSADCSLLSSPLVPPAICPCGGTSCPLEDPSCPFIPDFSYPSTVSSRSYP
jgi:hypothetical protein